MAPSREVWASAFAAQSESDWQVYDRLAAEPQIPSCHELHYLQMACEKIRFDPLFMGWNADRDAVLIAQEGQSHHFIGFR